MSESTGRTDPHDQDSIDPDGDPELRNPRDERDTDHKDTTDPDMDPDITNPRDTRSD